MLETAPQFLAHISHLFDPRITQRWCNHRGAGDRRDIPFAILDQDIHLGPAQALFEQVLFYGVRDRLVGGSVGCREYAARKIFRATRTAQRAEEPANLGPMPLVLVDLTRLSPVTRPDQTHDQDPDQGQGDE